MNGFIHLLDLCEGLKAERISRSDAEAIIVDLKAQMQKLGVPPDRVFIGGSFRREAPTVGDLDIALDDPHISKEWYQQFLDLLRREGHQVVTTRPHPKDPDRLINIPMGDEQCSFVMDGRTIELKKVKPDLLGAMLIHITGSGEFNKGMRVFAMAKGLMFSQAGLRDRVTGKLIAGKDEKGIFQALGVSYVEPKDRERWPYRIPREGFDGSFTPRRQDPVASVPPNIWAKVPDAIKQALSKESFPAVDDKGVRVPANLLWDKTARQNYYKSRGSYKLPDQYKLDRYTV